MRGKFSVKHEILTAITCVNSAMAKDPSLDLTKALQRLLRLYEDNRNKPSPLDVKRLYFRVEALENRMKKYEESLKKSRENSDKQFLMRSMLGAR